MGQARRLAEIIARIIALKTSGLQDEQVEQTIGGMVRVVHALRAEGERFELDPKLRDYFDKEVGLTKAQIDRVEGLSRRIDARARLEGMRKAMADKGGIHCGREYNNGA